ncbi:MULTISPECIES: hypothetical protein [Enterococcus]|uniref:Uncharacterized protein n=1 Tax=Enterococcus malodoratus ATCC 43197 TaxID=1158601 RepID=R2RN27_9ENTE|nr:MULTISPECIES: hypothetical protein [Enterococcus]BBM17033.1 hypothetical protein G15_0674 [Enterococcus avium]EOH77409.1 hypothetical protein UAI_02046 [Enterococcus malodoratus ATCC 43197]EOT64177.1 hypothetical protein I585_03374 [Enterococcus malodoratus ATCC 43197]OJG64374.1 hypothetical protein RV07_GL004347 [Enterococcus malodoratus]SES95070.1 hypothetical protein SAMN04487821_104126 [Enterococcus malodoratus]
MFDSSAKYFEKMAEDMGVSIKIPRPSKRSLQASAKSNTVVGVGLIAGGVLLSSKAMFTLGIIGLAGATALHYQLKD